MSLSLKKSMCIFSVFWFVLCVLFALWVVDQISAQTELLKISRAISKQAKDDIEENLRRTKDNRLSIIHTEATLNSIHLRLHGVDGRLDDIQGKLDVMDKRLVGIK